ncbi:unnamed protein product [Cylindrotheca closterium]|uniref:Uncharacterized protein n=1 Tax=Cylindrotheca closterium TaxID=2856 RepID=A0AAD2JKU4_9STRA|nr:unnamed protein product [Cylindrotheca closterium]
MLSEENLYSTFIDNVMSGGTSYFLGYDAYDAKRGSNMGQVEQQPQQLLDAILGNAISRVKNLLSRGVADPNTCLGIGPVNAASNNDAETPLVETTSNNAIKNNGFKAFSPAQPTRNTSKMVEQMKSIDKVFKWTRVFGNSPTLIHIAVLNIYHRHTRSRDLERALGILELLLEHGGAVDYRSMNIYLRSVAMASNPLDFAIGLQKKALYQKKENLAFAMTQAVGILRKPWKGGEEGITYNSQNIETNKIPFELVTFGCIDSAKNYLYQPTDHPDIQFIFSNDDGDTSVSSNEA